MASVLICTNPAVGHVTPLLSVARTLVENGDRVRILTGAAYRERVEAAGAGFVPLPPEADWDHPDYVDMPAPPTARGPAAMRHDLLNTFLRAGPHQWRAVQEALAAEPTDAVLAETLFVGAIPLLYLPRRQRPLLMNLGIVPLTVGGRGVPPPGLGLTPLRGPVGRIRDAALRVVARRLLLDAIDEAGNAMFSELLGRPVDDHFITWPERSDYLVQFTVESFEFPRVDLPAHVRFVGPVSRGNSGHIPRPGWWDDLDGSRPVVHVTQGTIANADYGDLILPAIEALADEDVLVVVALGGRPLDSLPGELPANVRVAELLPYDELFPLLDAVVTNGGYGGVHFALEHGVPLVVAGMTEDKPEVNARVGWSRAGINLRAQPPKPAAVRAAVRRVLRDPSYRARAAALGADIAAAPGPAAVSALIAEATAVR